MPIDEEPSNVQSRIEGSAQSARTQVLGSLDILQTIFRHLTIEDLCRASAVHKFWAGVANDPMFWTRVVFSSRGIGVDRVRLNE
jgi:F-box-like